MSGGCHYYFHLVITSLDAEKILILFVWIWYQAKLAAVKEKFGREIRVFDTSPVSSSSNEESKSGMKRFIFLDWTNEHSVHSICENSLFVGTWYSFLVYFYALQRSQRNSMSSLQRIIIELWHPKRKVSLISDILYKTSLKSPKCIRYFFYVYFTFSWISFYFFFYFFQPGLTGSLVSLSILQFSRCLAWNYILIHFLIYCFDYWQINSWRHENSGRQKRPHAGQR